VHHRDGGARRRAADRHLRPGRARRDGGVSADLDGVAAAKGYAVPIPSTATISFAQMQLAVKNGVGWRVLRTIFPAIGGHGDDTSIAADYRDAYKAFRQSVKDGTLSLVDASISTSEGGRALPRSFVTSNLTASRGDNLASAFLPMSWEP
jgi:hypothetical protein